MWLHVPSPGTLLSYFPRILYVGFLLHQGNTADTANQRVVMDGPFCGTTVQLGSATVMSHYESDPSRETYAHNVDCTVTFNSTNPVWKLMLDFEYIDIPDKSFNAVCGDAVYVYDSNQVGLKAFRAAGQNNGLCGRDMPATLSSSGPYITVVFQTDSAGELGRGFKFQITSFTADSAFVGRSPACSPYFYCASKQRCISKHLTCDRVNHCQDGSDEEFDGLSQCNPTEEDAWWADFLSLGIAACVGIIIGVIVVIILLVVCVVCTCKKCQKQPETEHRQSIPTSGHGSVSGVSSQPSNQQQVQYKDGITYHSVPQAGAHHPSEYQVNPNQPLMQGHPQGHPHGHPQGHHGYAQNGPNNYQPQMAQQQYRPAQSNYPPNHPVTIDGRPAIPMLPLQQDHHIPAHLREYNNSPFHQQRAGENHSYSSGYSSQQGMPGYQPMHTKPIINQRGYTPTSTSSQSSRSKSEPEHRQVQL